MNAGRYAGRHPDGTPKTTGTGSTQQHGPRFKRRRPTEEAQMVVEVETAGNMKNFIEDYPKTADNLKNSIEDNPKTAGNLVNSLALNPSTLDEVMFHEEILAAIGTGVGDTGATQPVMGAEVWAQWRDRLAELGKMEEIVIEKCHRRTTRCLTPSRW